MIIGSLGKYFFVWCLALAVSWFLTPLLIRLSHSTGLFLDQPRERGMHSKAVPRCGGISVFLGFHLCVAAVLLIPWGWKFVGYLHYDWWFGFLLSSSLLLIVGLLDDHLDIGAHYKLMGQIAAIFLAISFGNSMGRVAGYDLPIWIDIIFTLFWYLGFINAFNLIDGLDGLATGLAMIAAMGLGLVSFFLRVPGDALIIGGLFFAALGFLWYNFNPAKIFLGDTGSMFLGFAVASIALATNAKSPTIASLGVVLLAVGVPIFDTFLAIWRRSVRKFLSRFAGEKAGKLSAADKDHLHHRLVKLGLTQRSAAIWLYALNLAFVNLGLLLLVYKKQAVGIILIAFVIGTYMGVRYLARVEFWDSGSLILQGFKRPSKPVLAALMYPLFDVFFLGLTVTVLLALTQNFETYNHYKRAWFGSFPVWVFIPFIIIVLSGTYNRVWTRATVSSFVVLALSICSAAVVGIALDTMVGIGPLRERIIWGILYCAVSGAGVLGIRALPGVLQEILSFKHDELKNNHEVSRAVLYGAGDRGGLFLKRRAQWAIERSGKPLSVLGFIDDDISLRKRRVFGYPVLGTGDELLTLVAEKSINEIIVTAELLEEKIDSLKELAAQEGITLSVWLTEHRAISV